MITKNPRMLVLAKLAGIDVKQTTEVDWTTRCPYMYSRKHKDHGKQTNLLVAELSTSKDRLLVISPCSLHVGCYLRGGWKLL